MGIPDEDKQLCKGPVARGAWNTQETKEGKSGGGEGSESWGHITRILGLHVKISKQTWQGSEQRRGGMIRNES